MSGSIELLKDWVIETLGPLADDDDHNARLRDTLRVFLQENGSYKATAERLTLHKNTVQYRVRKAEESLGVPSARTAWTLNWPCWPANGWAQRYCGLLTSRGPAFGDRKDRARHLVRSSRPSRRARWRPRRAPQSVAFGCPAPARSSGRTSRVIDRTKFARHRSPRTAIAPVPHLSRPPYPGCPSGGDDAQGRIVIADWPG